jgi:hypothetical protein
MATLLEAHDAEVAAYYAMLEARSHLGKKRGAKAAYRDAFHDWKDALDTLYSLGDAAELRAMLDARANEGKKVRRRVNYRSGP